MKAMTLLSEAAAREENQGRAEVQVGFREEVVMCLGRGLVGSGAPGVLPGAPVDLTAGKERGSPFPPPLPYLKRCQGFKLTYVSSI